MNERKPRPKMKFTGISGPAVVLVVLIILGNILFSTFSKKRKVESNADRLKSQAIQVAQQVVSEKMGNAQPFTFPKKAEVEIKSSNQYQVASLLVTTTRGEPHSRAWIVNLQYLGGKGDKEKSWKVLSCDIGE